MVSLSEQKDCFLLFSSQRATRSFSPSSRLSQASFNLKKRGRCQPLPLPEVILWGFITCTFWDIDECVEVENLLEHVESLLGWHLQKVCVGVHVYIHVYMFLFIHAGRYLKKPEGAVRILRTRVTGYCELPHVRAGMKTSPLEERQHSSPSSHLSRHWAGIFWFIVFCCWMVKITLLSIPEKEGIASNSLALPVSSFLLVNIFIVLLSCLFLCEHHWLVQVLISAFFGNGKA